MRAVPISIDGSQFHWVSQKLSPMSAIVGGLSGFSLFIKSTITNQGGSNNLDMFLCVLWALMRPQNTQKHILKQLGVVAGDRLIGLLSVSKITEIGRGALFCSGNCKGKNRACKESIRSVKDNNSWY